MLNFKDNHNCIIDIKMKADIITMKNCSWGKLYTLENNGQSKDFHDTSEENKAAHSVTVRHILYNTWRNEKYM